MSNASKVMIVLLVALVAAYVVVFVLGATRDSNEKSDPSAASWTETIYGLLVQSQGLEARDVTVSRDSDATCLQGSDFVVPADSTCTYAVAAASGASVRNVGLSLKVGQSVEVALAQEGSLTAKKTLTGTQTLKGFSVQQAGGTLSLRCAAGGEEKTCRLALK